MPRSKAVKPREGLIEISEEGGVYTLTEQGIAEVYRMASLNASHAEIASKLRVSREWVSKAVDIGGASCVPEMAEAYHDGKSAYIEQLREAQLELAKVNASMAIHLGKIDLGQHDKPQEHIHRHQVIGTMPDYNQTTDQWKRQFGPTPLQTIENQVEEAQVVDIEDFDDEDAT